MKQSNDTVVKRVTSLRSDLVELLAVRRQFRVDTPKNSMIKIPIDSGTFEVIQHEWHNRGTDLEVFFFMVQSQRTNGKIYNLRMDSFVELYELHLLSFVPQTETRSTANDTSHHDEKGEQEDFIISV